MLAVLLLNLGRAVSPEVLIDRVWGEQPPVSVRNALYGYMARLRKIIAAAAEPEVELARSPGGYFLRAPAGQLDLHRFRRMAEDAATADDDQSAAAKLREALGLWRGTALAGVDSPWLRAMRQTLELERAAVVLDLNEVRLRLGEHAALVSELSGQAAASGPADERLAGQLMLALYRCGRQAEALGWFEQTRQQLAGELGADPGPELQALHQQILRADPALAAPRPAGLGPVRIASVPMVPQQLPAAVADFTGRAAELKTLTRILDQGAAGAAGTVVISAIGGTAGVGKTALALHWAYQVAQRFPDGQLHVNLRGYDPDQPVTASDALAGFLRALGVPGPDIPPGQDERAARYRSLLAGKKMLIVLDNAGSVEQVRLLLPGSPGCAVVVTSRDSLAGLVARHGAARLTVDLLPPAEAVGLLRALIGRRADDDPGAAATLAGQCCRLPLALRVAAELASVRPDMTLAELVSDLSDQQRRLDLLDADKDPRTAVRTVFSWSHRHLDSDTARVFRLAGLHPGTDFDPYAAAALTDATLEQARGMLDTLARAHLIQLAGPGRYGMHDLLRAYARELTDAVDAPEQQRAALTQLFDHYVYTAATAMDALYPAEHHRRPHVDPPGAPAPPLTEAAAARGWLDAQRPTLVAVTVHAAGHGWPGHAARLSAILFRYLDAGGHYPEALTIHSHACIAARRAGDRAAEGAARNYLGTVHYRQGRYQQAADHYQQALALFRETGDHTAQARALNNLGAIHYYQGHYREAITLYRQVLVIFGETGDPFGKANTLGNLATNEERLGRYDMAARHYEQTRALAADIGDTQTECFALLNLGIVRSRQSRYQQAADHLHRALAMSHETGHRDDEAAALAAVGDLRLRQGHLEEATRHLQDALAMYREIGKPSGEADALNTLGEVLLADGRPDRARSQHDTALGLAAQTGDKYQQARAHRGLGEACRVGGDLDQARRQWQQALALFTELGTPETEQVRDSLVAARNDSHGKTSR